MSDGIFGSDKLAFEAVTPMRSFSPSSITHFEPLMAVIMTYLPNLTRLIAIMSHGDPFFASLLHDPTRTKGGIHARRVAFQLLKDGAFYKDERKTFPDYGQDIGYCGPLLEDVLAAWTLPKMENLTISGLSPGTSFLEEDSLWAGWYSVTNLVLIYNAFYPLNYDMALTTIAAPATLAKLSLCFTNGAPFEHPEVMTNAELWKMLTTYQCSLQHLNVYRDVLKEESGFQGSGNDHMGLLCGLSNLETLSIQPEVLLGGCCGTDKAPFHLKETLPLSLRSLTFYDPGKDKDMFSDLETQLIEIVHDRRYASLGSIILEDQTHGWWKPKSTLRTETLEQTCEEAKVELRIYQGCTDPSERMACFPALPGLERAVFHPEESYVSDYDMLGEVRQTADLDYGSSMMDKMGIE